jgi:hypothetical protein
MNVFKILDKGLCVIGVLVAVVWGMIVAPHSSHGSDGSHANPAENQISTSLQMQDHAKYSSRPPRPHANLTGELQLTRPTSSKVDAEHQILELRSECRVSTKPSDHSVRLGKRFQGIVSRNGLGFRPTLCSEFTLEMVHGADCGRLARQSVA